MIYYYNYISILLILLLILLLIFFLKKANRIYNSKLKILYEDFYIIVIDKPAYIAVHNAPDFNWNGPTIVDTLISDGHSLYKNKYDIYQTGVVHRLDEGTTGVMVLAKNEFAYKNLKDQFKYHTVKKIYNALIYGILDEPNGTINLPIALINKDDNIYGVKKNGKPSITHYKTLTTYNGLGAIPPVSLLEINLETGRTHQIRVHFSTLNHPLVGDPKYGSFPMFDDLTGLKRQWLHAKHLEFNHPLTGKRFIFNSDYPNDLKNSLSLFSNNII